MRLREVVEEIQEKLPNYTSPESIVRKITFVRDKLIRTSGSWQQQTDVVDTSIDLVAGQAQYDLPCPPGNITEIMLFDTAFRKPYDPVSGQYLRGIPVRQFNQDNRPYYGRPYYYIVAGKIGIVPTPTFDAVYGIKIFHLPVLIPLTLQGMGGDTGFDPNFDMLLVYGALQEMASGNAAQEFNAKYQDLLQDYKRANNGGENYVVQSRWNRVW